MPQNREIRCVHSELRVSTIDGKRKLSGTIPYNSRSADLGGFEEEIAPGAFASALGSAADILCLRDHDQKILLGRTKSRTLSLEDTAQGLRYQVELPDTTQAADLAVSVERGDLDGASFGFVCNKDSWSWDNGRRVRRLEDVQLIEISPCSFAAYPASAISLRSAPTEFRAGLKRENRYARVTAAVAGTAWAILPEKLQTICGVLQARANGQQISQEEVRAAMMASKSPAAQQAGKVAIIPVYGVISPRMNMFSEFSGGTSVEQISAAFKAAMADPGVTAIVFDVDSPGGNVAGIPELGAQIFAARSQGKKIVSVANSMAASAAYWLAAACDEFAVTPSGEVGSIGVYMEHDDFSGALEKDGVVVTLVSAGRYKTEGNPYEPLPDEARDYMQQQVDTFYGMFTEAVAQYRGVDVKEVTGGFGQARCVLAADAVKQGMADRVATLEQVLAELGASDPRTSYAAETSGAVAAEMNCACACDACQSGDCANCSADGCTDPNCPDCPMQDDDDDDGGYSEADARRRMTLALAERRNRQREITSA